MRCHIYDDHNEIEKPLLRCDWPSCSASFTVMWGLKRHVQRDHIQRKITKEFTPGQENSPDKPEDQEENIEDLNNAEKQQRDVDCPVSKTTTRTRRRKKGIEEIVDADIQEDEAVKKMRKKKKFHRIAWLPSCSVCEAKYIAIEKMDSHMATACR